MEGGRVKEKEREMGVGVVKDKKTGREMGWREGQRH